jgi:hypothetical protein
VADSVSLIDAPEAQCQIGAKRKAKLKKPANLSRVVILSLLTSGVQNTIQI